MSLVRLRQVLIVYINNRVMSMVWLRNLMERGKCMEKEVIVTEKAPSVVGPYSLAVKIESMLFVSGQIGLDPLTNELVTGGIESQIIQVFKNLMIILEEANTSLDNVVKVTIFLKDMDNFKKVNKIYGEYFNKDFPARSCIEVSALPKNAEIEIEAIAYISE